MNGRPFTLIDVMRGVKKHKLADKLGDGTYKFLVELILEANELGFKNPIDLTVKQALAIGGGESRQTLYNRRNSLRKILLNGKHLVKVQVGSHARRSLATYEIDYHLLCSYNGVWQGFKGQSSNEIDESLTHTLTHPLRELDGSLDSSLPILRSDQSREEDLDQPNLPKNEIETPVSDTEDNESDEEPPSQKTMELAAIMRAVNGKYEYKLTLTDPQALKILRKHPAGGIDFWLWVVKMMPEWDDLTIRHANGILGYGEKLWLQYKKANNIQVFF